MADRDKESAGDGKMGVVMIVTTVGDVGNWANLCPISAISYWTAASLYVDAIDRRASHHQWNEHPYGR